MVVVVLRVGMAGGGGGGRLNISCYLEIFFKQPRYIINVLQLLQKS